MTRKYFIHCALSHPTFRLPELQSIAELYGFHLRLQQEEGDPSRAFVIADLDEEIHARYLARRCILVKSDLKAFPPAFYCAEASPRAVYELWAYSSTDLDALHNENLANKHLWEGLGNDTFRFNVTAIGHTIPTPRKVQIMERFKYMAYTGSIDMANAALTMCYIEEYPEKNIMRDRLEGDGKFSRAYFGRLIEEGSARQLILKYDIKQRAYYGNTTMDAEMSLIMANQALASPGKLIYDPFVGTGSMLYTSAEFGALVLGSDIDGRQMRGKGYSTPGVLESASQYGVQSRILDCCTFDIAQNPFRRGGILDAIISDPPYGVRAGAKRLGRKNPLKFGIPPSEVENPIDKIQYIKKPYELSDLTADLVLLARYLLKPNGRLVWFLPTPTDEYQDVDIPVCHGMEIVSNSEQTFGKWGRRLITMRKISVEEYLPPSFDASKREEEMGTAAALTAGHKDFRLKYFAKFNKKDTTVSI